MNISTDIIKFAQHLLAQKGLYNARIDGYAGPRTLAALNNVEKLPKSWTPQRKLIGFIQLEAFANGFDPYSIDGYWGANTDNAYQQFRHQLEYGASMPIWRPEELVSPVNPNGWPLDNVSALDAFYGPKAKNLVTYEVPYLLKLAWPPYSNVSRITSHRLVKDSVLRILTQVKSVYGMAEIERLRLNMYGGCFADRPIRGGTRPSTHAWGIALDFDPDNNQLKWGRDKAHFARPEYHRWWEIWEAEGWVSLGRTRNYDWMHVQAAKIET